MSSVHAKGGARAAELLRHVPGKRARGGPLEGSVGLPGELQERPLPDARCPIPAAESGWHLRASSARCYAQHKHPQSSRKRTAGASTCLGSSPAVPALCPFISCWLLCPHRICFVLPFLQVHEGEPAEGGVRRALTCSRT